MVTEEETIFRVRHFVISGSGRLKDQEPYAARIVGSQIPKSRKMGHGQVDFDISSPEDSKDREQGECFHRGSLNHEKPVALCRGLPFLKFQDPDVQEARSREMWSPNSRSCEIPKHSK